MVLNRLPDDVTLCKFILVVNGISVIKLTQATAHALVYLSYAKHIVSSGMGVASC